MLPLNLFPVSFRRRIMKLPILFLLLSVIHQYRYCPKKYTGEQQTSSLVFITRRPSAMLCNPLSLTNGVEIFFWRTKHFVHQWQTTINIAESPWVMKTQLRRLLDFKYPKLSRACKILAVYVQLKLSQQNRVKNRIEIVLWEIGKLQSSVEGKTLICGW